MRGRARVQLRNPARNFFQLTLDRADAKRLLAPIPELNDLIGGELSLVVRGTLGREMRGSGTVTLSRGSVGGAEVAGLRVPFSYATAPGGYGRFAVHEASTLAGSGQARGSLTVDDEGTPTSCNTLIESGILKGCMFDKLNARLMGVKSTGNGRRESFAHTPMPRMTNTYMLPGKYDPEEIIASVDRGIYAPNFGGGQVDITSGKFVFSASEAYQIEGGKVGRPVKGATLIGNGPDVLTKVSMIGNDSKLDDGVGTCGKDGQSVPVGVGQPTMRIDGLTVGGTAA